MYLTPETKVPSKLILTALLSSGLTSVISIFYIVLCTLGLMYRFDCNAASSSTPSQYFWHTLYKVYVQAEHCNNPTIVDNVTRPYTVYVFLSITLSFSILTLITSIVLASTVRNKEMYKYLNIFVFAYIGSWVGSLIVDVAFASHLGIDYTNLTALLESTPTYNYQIDIIRQGAFILLAISLKGYAAHALNLLLIMFLVGYACNYQDNSEEEEHPVRKLGPVNAYEQPRRLDESWVNDVYTPPFTRAQNNKAFEDDEPRNQARNDYFPSRSSPFNRSDSWQRQPTSATNNNQVGRPFTYLEELQRPVALKPVPSPSNEPTGGWRRDWPPPPVPVPAPDYSPHQQRRLKSALKPAYY